MSKFKVGEAKTSGGHDAYIFEIGDTIFGRIKDEYWFSGTWRLDGKSAIRVYDLLPNVEPLRAEFEEVVMYSDYYYGTGKTKVRSVVVVPEEFAGKCVKVTLESLE